MFDSFQFHPRPPGDSSGKHFVSGCAGSTSGEGFNFDWRNASDVSFSKPFNTGATQDLSPIAASDIHYKAPLVVPSLSPREREVLVWAGRGKSAWETAQLLGLSEATIKSYIRNACTRLGVKNKTHAVAVALTHGLFRI